MLNAEQIMTSNVVTIRPEALVKDAIELLLNCRISGLPVVDEAGTLVGMITEYALLAMAYDSQVTDQTVAEHMTRDVISVECDTPANGVADQFIVHRVRRLAVTHKGRLVGLVSRVDVLRALYEAKAPVCTA